MKRMTYVMFMAVAIIGFVFNVGWATEALAKEPIELTMLFFGPAQIYETKIVKKYFVDEVNEKAKGELKIVVKGGPEVMSIFDQPVAVKKGLIDMCLTSYTFFPNLVPGSELFRAAEFTPVELRKNGADDFFRGKCAKAGLYYLGNPMPNPAKYFYILSRKKLQTKDDFKGVRIAGSPPFFSFFTGLGAVPQTMKNLKDYFTLLERGVAEAHIASLSVFLGIGTYELAHYVIDEPFFNSTQVLLMNLDKWNSLPGHLQKLMQEVMLEAETTASSAQAEWVKSDQEKLEKAGTEFYKLSPEMAKWFLGTSIEAPWIEAEKKYPAELMQEYRKFLRR